MQWLFCNQYFVKKFRITFYELLSILTLRYLKQFKMWKNISQPASCLCQGFEFLTLIYTIFGIIRKTIFFFRFFFLSSNYLFEIFWNWPQRWCFKFKVFHHKIIGAPLKDKFKPRVSSFNMMKNYVFQIKELKKKKK